MQAVNEAIPRLLDAGVLKQTTVGRRNRAFEAAELIDSFIALERQLAGPEADTLTSADSTSAVQACHLNGFKRTCADDRDEPQLWAAARKMTFRNA